MNTASRRLAGSFVFGLAAAVSASCGDLDIFDSGESKKPTNNTVAQTGNDSMTTNQHHSNQSLPGGQNAGQSLEATPHSDEAQRIAELEKMLQELQNQLASSNQDNQQGMMGNNSTGFPPLSTGSGPGALFGGQSPGDFLRQMASSMPGGFPGGDAKLNEMIAKLESSFPNNQ